MNNGKERVKLSKVIQKMNLVNLTPQIDVSGIWLNLPDVNRPALQLTGFFEHFDSERVQIIGYVIMTDYRLLVMWSMLILRVFLSRRDMKDICSFCQVIFHVLYSAGV